MPAHHAHDTVPAVETGPRHCERLCPLGIPVRDILSLLEQGRKREARLLLLAHDPFPGMTGRLCHQPCRQGCPLSETKNTPDLRGLERFTAEQGRRDAFEPLAPSGKRVAVIGAGPAGLSAARFAALYGHRVDVYERAPLIGGIPRLVIPGFRLPSDAANREAAEAVSENVRVFTNVTVGRDILLADLLERYDACVLAVGLWTERMLTMPGMEHFQPAFAWLQRMTLAPESMEGRDVAVLGGSDVAFDCARTALRLKARSVQIICLESEEYLLSTREDAALAKAEGVQLRASVIGRVLKQESGRLRLEAERVRSFHFNEYCQLCVDLEENSACAFEADVFFCSNGLVFDDTVLSGVDVTLNSRGRVLADEGGRTSIPKLFAAGDMASGPGRVATAIASGRRAADALHTFLSGQPAPRLFAPEAGELRRASCSSCPETPLSAAWADPNPLGLPFGEHRPGLSVEDAARERGLCLSCPTCQH